MAEKLMPGEQLELPLATGQASVDLLDWFAERMVRNLPPAERERLLRSWREDYK
jgi:hypothetical protein